MKTHEYENGPGADVIIMAGAVASGLLAYHTGLSEFTANGLRSVGMEPWNMLSPEVRAVAFAGLKTSMSCFYGFAGGVVLDLGNRMTQDLALRADAELVGKLYRFHPARFLSPLC